MSSQIGMEQKFNFQNGAVPTCRDSLYREHHDALRIRQVLSNLLERKAEREMESARRVALAWVQVVPVLKSHRTDDRFPPNAAAH